MAAPNLDPINTAVTKRILPGMADNFFKNDPVLAFMKRNRYIPYPGGPQIQSNFLYKPMTGGAYSKGDTFDTSKRQTFAGTLFVPKYYYVNVTEYLEDIEVEVKGPTAVLSMVKTDMGNASLTMAGKLAVAFYQHGQNKGAGTLNRSKHINGLEEALTDGTNTTWSGQTFASYGSQVRADVNGALSSPAGLVAANVNGRISYRVLEHTYQSCVIGEENPVIGATTNRCMGYINENFQPAQRVDTVEPTIGFTGIKFKKATIVQSQYIAGADGVNDADLGNYNNATETFWWLNPGPEGDDAYLQLHISTSPKFAFGFTGFKVAQNGTAVSGQLLFAGQLVCRSPRLMRGLFGING